MQLAIRLVQSTARKGRIPEAYLCPIRTGNDRERYGKILASKLLCLEGSDDCPERIFREVHPDFHVVRAAKKTVSIDQIRNLKGEVSYSPVEAPRKIYFFPWAENLSTPAANSLLKIMEDPPHFLHFLLVAEDLSELPATVISRCQRIPLGGLTRSDMRNWALDWGLNGKQADLMVEAANGRAALLKEMVEEYTKPLESAEDFSRRCRDLEAEELGQLLASSSNWLKLHEAARYFFLSLFNFSGFSLLQVAESLSEADRDRVGFVLQKGARIYRNILFGKVRAEREESERVEEPSQVSASAVREINRSLVDLERNSNLQLLLESLFFRLTDDELTGRPFE